MTPREATQESPDPDQPKPQVVDAGESATARVLKHLRGAAWYAVSIAVVNGYLAYGRGAGFGESALTGVSAAGALLGIVALLSAVVYPRVGWFRRWVDRSAARDAAGDDVTWWNAASCLVLGAAFVVLGLTASRPGAWTVVSLGLGGLFVVGGIVLVVVRARRGRLADGDG